MGIDAVRVGSLGVVALGVTSFVLTRWWGWGALVLLAMVTALPGPDLVSLGRYVGRAVHHVVTPRVVEFQEVEVDAVWLVRDNAPFQRWCLVQRGRLDLGGDDVAIAHSIVHLLESIAGSGGGQVTLRVERRGGEFVTTLSAPASAPVGLPWRLDVDHVVGGRVLRRWSYVRGSRKVARVMRVREVTSSPAHGVLARAWREAPHVEWSVHYEVVASERAGRLVGRSSHQIASDAAFAQAAGFRRSERLKGLDRRTRQRETDVAAGRALVRVGVFATVEADNLGSLRSEIQRTRRRVATAGVVLESGYGRQGHWWLATRPGIP